MSTINEQAEEFRRFVNEQHLSGDNDLTIAELFQQWQLTTLPDGELQESLLAFDRGVEDAKAGRTRDAKEVITESRKRIQQMQ